MGEEARKKLFLPEQGKPWRSLPAFDESSIGNADYLNAYLERVEFLAKVLEYSSQPFSLVTPEGEILDCNPAFLNMVGYTKEELSSISWDKDLTPSEWHDVQNHYLGKLQKTGVPVRYEKEYLTKDGRRIAVELLVHQFTDRESGKRHYYSFITDISQRKKAEESQRDLERHLADIIDFLPDATFVIDASGRVMRWNRAVADMTGIRAEEMVGKSNHEYALPFYGFRRPILADLALNTSIQRPEYMYFQRKFLTLVAESYCPAIKGGGAYVWAKASPLFDQNGRLMGAIETLRDMTKHKQSEEALRQSEERYRNILESIEDGYFEVDIRGNLTFSNNSLNESLGYLKQDLFNMNYKQYMDSENARKVFQAFNKVYLTKEPTREVDWHLTRQDGSKLFAEASVSAILNSQGKVSGFRGIVRDVTQRKEAEEALRQSESKYRLVFENTPLGILHFDGQGRITACNESLIQIVGPSEKGTLIGFNLLHLPEKGLAIMGDTYLAGGTIFLMSGFNVEKVLKCMEEKEITIFGGVPTMYAMLAAFPEAEKYDISLVERWACGGAPLSPEIREAFEKRFNKQIMQGYGLTETGAGITVQRHNRPRKPGSSGLPTPGAEIRIVNDEGQSLPSGEVGEIIVRGPYIMKGYYRNKAETERAIRDGWLYTGDVGYLDEEGEVYIVERKNDLIIRGGFNIYPSEVEKVLTSHPDISDAGVLGVPDERYGEKVCALIVPNKGAVIDKKDIQLFCREKLANYKVPSYIEFRDSIPKNQLGKLLRRELPALVNPADLVEVKWD